MEVTVHLPDFWLDSAFDRPNFPSVVFFHLPPYNVRFFYWNETRNVQSCTRTIHEGSPESDFGWSQRLTDQTSLPFSFFNFVWIFPSNPAFRKSHPDSGNHSARQIWSDGKILARGGRLHFSILVDCSCGELFVWSPSNPAFRKSHPDGRKF